MVPLTVRRMVGALSVVCASCGTSGENQGTADGGGAHACISASDCRGVAVQCNPGPNPICFASCPLQMVSCVTDNDCKVVDDAAPLRPMVCEPTPCGTLCILACSSSCLGGDPARTACDPSGHCNAQVCKVDADCPSDSGVDYTCVRNFGVAFGMCSQKTCKTNADCGAHFCVEGHCFRDQGICGPGCQALGAPGSPSCQLS